MPSNAGFIASTTALLADPHHTAAKSFNVDQPDHVARSIMLGMVEDLHCKLEAPEEAIFRQSTNVRSCRLSIEDVTF